MARIEFSGNIGKVESGQKGDNTYIAFSVAERYAYFDRQINEWIEKGTEWRDCIIWIPSDNQKKIARILKFVTKGAGVLVTGRTSINPSDEKDEKGRAKYLNPYVNVDEVALTTERIEEVTYKPKAVIQNAADDPEIQQTEKTPIDDDPFENKNF